MLDYHSHLEEGPYSFRWLERTAQALLVEQNIPHTKEAMMDLIPILAKRIEKGCYSDEWLDLYLQTARQKGLKEVGIVDHLYRFKETRCYFEEGMIVDHSTLGNLQRTWLDQVMTENIADFIHAIERAKPKWQAAGIALRMGIEADYFPGQEAELKQLLEKGNWDFVIGATHFLNGWGFDNPETSHYFKKLEREATYTAFYTVVEQSIRSGLFDFIAHLDNLKVFNYHLQDRSLADKWHNRLARALVETQTATEVNAGLYYRYPVKEVCPGPELLKVLIHHGVDLTISSDAHFPDDLGTHVYESMHLLHELGVTELATFENRKKIMKKIEEV